MPRIIKSIRANLVKGKVALVIEPALTPELFGVMRKLLSDAGPAAPVLNSLQLELHGGDLLFYAPVPTQHHRDTILSLIGEAEKRLPTPIAPKPPAPALPEVAAASFGVSVT